MTVSQALDRSTVQEKTSYSLEKELRVTEAEYWQKYYNHPDMVYEWHNGYLEERPVSDYVTVSMYKFFYELLRHYLNTRPIAKSVVLAMGFRLTFAKEIAIRRPDLAVVLNENPMPILPGDKSYKGTYDACIEAVSNSSKEDTERDTVSKKREYAKGGVREYYILDGYGEHTQFYRLNARGVYAPIRPTKDGLVKSKVLPGFQFRKADLYTPPSLDELVEDTAYQGFVLPGYSKAKQEAAEAKQQATEAKQQARKAKQQARKAKQQASKTKQETKAKQQASEVKLLAEQEKRARLAMEAENARLKALLAGKTKTG
ncbi:MAG: Uma2 family endonuclease [Gammaproteobacteria bacterium]|nr:Uma2 family endonuclease [Gammaproteobacteria bacterium]